MIDKRDVVDNNEVEGAYEKDVNNTNKKVDPTDPCDPSSPDYPWVPCGLNKDTKKENK
ncbi:hypothetical protein [Clostridium baratii]|uniref:Uncharacterized protein n=1 Tax=Clostridium baratii TaxID=1561 RepID=A0A174R562_9CLOT|nr:hypothetical protein [Clostridium baratii]CUP80653.1 Uncharacterised protein [Clostridium baratii]